MKALFIFCLVLCFQNLHGQQLKEYIPSGVSTVLQGFFDGIRDGSMFRCDGCSDFMNGKQSWTLKYKDRDPHKGPAYWGSTNLLVFTTDAPHLANFFSHQFNSMSLVLSPGVKGSLGKKILYAIGWSTLRQLGHAASYNLLFKQHLP